MTSSGISYRKTHNLGELIDLLHDNGIPLPPDIEDVRSLTPFAAELRYDEFLPDSGSVFDRFTALRHVERTRGWVESLLT